MHRLSWFPLATILSATALAQITSTQPTFDVASVKPIPADSPQRPPRIDQQLFDITGTLYVFIADAYGLRPCLRKESFGCALISREPAWTKKDRFEIQAKLPTDFPAFTRFQFSDGEAPQLDQMLRTLLEDRFKLKVHHETRELPVYVLTVARSASKLKAVDTPEIRKTADGSSFKIQGLDEIESVQSENGNQISRLDFKYTSMQRFAETLTGFLDRPVLNRTGLDGIYDFKLDYESEPDVPTTTGNSPFGRLINAGPVIFSAIQEQLGLKIETAKAAVDVLVIDRAEKPAEN